MEITNLNQSYEELSVVRVLFMVVEMFNVEFILSNCTCVECFAKYSVCSINGLCFTTMYII